MNRVQINIIIYIINFTLITPQSYAEINSVRNGTKNLSLNKQANNKASFNTSFVSRPTLFNSYGPLLIDMNNIKYSNRIFFLPTINDQTKPLFLAVYCPQSLINVKGYNSWKGWKESFYSFENNLVNKLCNSVEQY